MTGDKIQFKVKGETLEFGMGYLPEPPSAKDLKFKEVIAPKLPRTRLKQVDFRIGNKEILSQGSTSSCVGHSSGNAVELCTQLYLGSKIKVSYYAIYAWARRANGNQKQGLRDSGAYIRNAFDIMRTIGVPDYDLWPSVPAKVNVMPPASVEQAAASRKITQSLRVETLDDMKGALSIGLSPVGGFTCYSSLNQAYRSGLVPMPTTSDRKTGAHAVNFVGFDDYVQTPAGKGVLIAENSWSQSIGDKGYLYLPYQYFPMISDIWVGIF
jgi:C1A family cysteine protease